MKNYKIIFSWLQIKSIHEHISLKLYLFDVKDPVKLSPSIFGVCAMPAGVPNQLRL